MIFTKMMFHELIYVFLFVVELGWIFIVDHWFNWPQKKWRTFFFQFSITLPRRFIVVDALSRDAIIQNFS